jgi:hypothetical protein
MAGAEPHNQTALSSYESAEPPPPPTPRGPLPIAARSMQLLRSGARGSLCRLRQHRGGAARAPMKRRLTDGAGAGAGAGGAAAPAPPAAATAAAAPAATDASAPTDSAAGVPGAVVVRPEEYDSQLAAKMARVRGLFAGFDVPDVEVHRSAPEHYRQRAEFRCGRMW